QNRTQRRALSGKEAERGVGPHALPDASSRVIAITDNDILSRVQALQKVLERVLPLRRNMFARGRGVAVAADSCNDVGYQHSAGFAVYVDPEEVRPVIQAEVAGLDSEFIDVRGVNVRTR